MKKNLLVFLAFVTFQIAYGQKVEISPYIGYRLGGRIDVYNGPDLGYIRFEDGESYGIDLSYEVRDGLSVNLQWAAQSTTMRFYGYNASALENLGDAFNNYFFLSGLYEKNTGIVTPFFGFGLGVATLDPDDAQFETAVRMAFNLQGGVKFDLGHRLALKIRAAMLGPLQFGSGGLYCGVGTGGSGCSVGVGASSSIIQGDFSAGIVFKVGPAETGGKFAPSPTTSPNW